MKRVSLSHVVVSALAWGALCVAASAQEAGPSRTPEPPPPAQATSGRQPDAATRTPPGEAARDASGAEDADLAITGRVTAGDLLFRKVPNPRVEFTGRPRRETVWEADRQNLPAQVQPGVTYRDIGITLRITSVFADIDRIVAEALGEIPTSDDAPRNEPPPRTTPPAPQGAPPAPATTAPDSQSTQHPEGARAAGAPPPTPQTRDRRRPRRGRLR